MEDSFLQARIDRLKTQIEKYEDAIDALVDGKVTQYTLNTGQGSQFVTKADLVRLQNQVDLMMSRYQAYCVRLNGGGTNIVRPGW